MALPTSGRIKMSDIATELGVSKTGLRLGATSVRNLAGVPSGRVMFSQLRGKASIQQFVIAATRSDLNLFTLAGSPTVAGKFRFTINSGVTVGQVSAAAAVVYGQFPSGSEIELINYGSIQARGGASNGGAGGDAVKADYPNQVMTLINNGTIHPGGGGGGRGGTGGLGGQGGNGYYYIYGAEYYGGNASSANPTYFYSHETALNDVNGPYQFSVATWYATNGAFVPTHRVTGITTEIVDPYDATKAYKRGTVRFNQVEDIYGTDYDGDSYYMGQQRIEYYGIMLGSRAVQVGSAGGVGGLGGNGGVGRGYNQNPAVGSTGAIGNPGAASVNNAGAGGRGGTGGTGGNGGEWGAVGGSGSPGATGATGANASAGNGLAGSAGNGGAVGGAAGRAIVKGTANFTLSNSGTVVGATV